MSNRALLAISKVEGALTTRTRRTAFLTTTRTPEDPIHHWRTRFVDGLSTRINSEVKASPTVHPLLGLSVKENRRSLTSELATKNTVVPPQMAPCLPRCLLHAEIVKNSMEINPAARRPIQPDTVLMHAYGTRTTTNALVSTALILMASLIC